MSIEHDDEATVFDPAPWGAHDVRYSLPAMPRVSLPLQRSSICPVPSLVGAAGGRGSIALPPASQVATSRARLAIPIGALAAVFAIAAAYLIRSNPAPASGAAALSIESSAPIIQLEAVPTSVADAVTEPAPESDVLIEMDDDPVARPAVAAKPRPRRKGKSTKKRPRRIIAGDVSTPLGDLRPRKAW